jgi:hypothetical protein
MRLLLLSVLTASLAMPAVAQQVLTSSGPDRVAVSIYRDPDRGSGGITLGNLGGFALISEMRTVDLPAGETDIRFEGVADGMISVSAIVTGLPGGTVQKNRDAALLSPASLVDGSLGNRVSLRRTDPATGTVREDAAIVRSSAEGAVVVETATGFETLRCSGLPETLVYNGIPAGLSARPTLSVRTRSLAAQRAVLTLTYLSTGFDWSTQYVAEMRGDGGSVDLLAWMTVANSNSASFSDASLNALAGKLNVTSDYRRLGTPATADPLYLRCYPLGSGRYGQPDIGYVPAAAPPPPSPMMMAPGEIIVTAKMRSENLQDAVAAVAEMEALGDLKLYRVPMPTTVAANAQKQVALLVKEKIPILRIYQLTVGPDYDGDWPAAHLLRIDNGKGKGLGEPLPSGQVAVFEWAAGERRYAGASLLRDHAVGEKVNLVVGTSSQVRLTQKKGQVRGGWTSWESTLTNANPHPVTVEVRFDINDYAAVDRLFNRLPRQDGYALWAVTVPANGTKKLSYRIKD